MNLKEKRVGIRFYLIKNIPTSHNIFKKKMQNKCKCSTFTVLLTIKCLKLTHHFVELKAFVYYKYFDILDH